MTKAPSLIIMGSAVLFNFCSYVYNDMYLLNSVLEDNKKNYRLIDKYTSEIEVLDNKFFPQHKNDKSFSEYINSQKSQLEKSIEELQNQIIEKSQKYYLVKEAGKNIRDETSKYALVLGLITLLAFDNSKTRKKDENNNSLPSIH
ncbi:MAG TPA: hypothetical protein VEC16_03790 [Alphaproteobacteria bacterium]|nr:hypothetical protein [Alphaproteobacteria bacterium]